MKNGRNNNRHAKILDSLLIFGTFGIVSILLDLDHIITLIQKDIPITAANLIYFAGRPLHLLVFILCCALLLYCAAHLYRLYRARI